MAFPNERVNAAIADPPSVIKNKIRAIATNAFAVLLEKTWNPVKA
jgi:hypothetical protein